MSRFRRSAVHIAESPFSLLSRKCQSAQVRLVDSSAQAYHTCSTDERRVATARTASNIETRLANGHAKSSVLTCCAVHEKRSKSPVNRLYSTNAANSSVSADEISHFDTLASTWWDPNGSSGLLHKMNPPRIGFIKSHIPSAPVFLSDADTSGPFWLLDQKTLDIGCGGGLLSEALTRVGGKVTGVDASAAGIAVAKKHADQMGLEVEYLHTSAEELAQTRAGNYDVVCAMEVLEHVASPPSFLQTALSLVKPGGILFVSTIEKTRFAQLLTCTIAEDILRLVPKGTHKYDKFVPKAAIKKWMSELSGEVIDTRGIIFDPLAGTWRVLSKGQAWGEACNYIMAIRKSA